MQTTRAQVDEFTVQKYTLVRRMIPEKDGVELLQYAIERSKTGTMKPDSGVPNTPAAYGDPYMEELLERLIPAVEKITSLRVFPTYSYFRVYKRGDVLKRHTDRKSCEVSVSLTLGYLSETAWPLWIEGPLGATAIEMNPGDAVVYRGIDCPHWREAFNGEFAAQVFMHYVDQNGPQAEWKFDKRRHIGKLPRHVSIVSTLAPAVLRSDRKLELKSGTAIPVDDLRSCIWKAFEADRPVVAIVDQLITKFGITRSEASIELMEFISVCEENSLLVY
jgi:hypothetical protein